MAGRLVRALPTQRCRARWPRQCIGPWRQVRSFSLLAQLPDYAAGSKAMAEGRFTEALPMLQRSVEVADAYFPADAGAELIECHSSLGSCLWHTGHYDEAARLMSKSSSEDLQLGAALILFDLGRFEEAATLLEAARASRPRLRALLRGALQLVKGETLQDLSTEAWPSDVAAMWRLNQLIQTSGEGDSAALQALQSDLDASDTASSTWLMLRCSLGEMAVTKGVKDDWLRESLVKTLGQFDRLQPKDPPGQAVVFRALTALATLTNAQGDAITAEGLFRSAQDHAAKHAAPGRAALWRRRVADAFAHMLETGRHAEQRKPEIQHLRGAAPRAPSESDSRWAQVVLPQPVEFQVE